jgi:hypothetical protein
MQPPEILADCSRPDATGNGLVRYRALTTHKMRLPRMQLQDWPDEGQIARA